MNEITNNNFGAIWQFGNLKMAYPFWSTCFIFCNTRHHWKPLILSTSWYTAKLHSSRYPYRLSHVDRHKKERARVRNHQLTASQYRAHVNVSCYSNNKHISTSTAWRRLCESGLQLLQRSHDSGRPRRRRRELLRQISYLSLKTF